MPITTESAPKHASQPKLNIAQKVILLRGALNPTFFNKKTRPMLYKICNNDPETVHELMLENLKRHGSAIRRVAPYFFKPPENLMIDFMGYRILPFGTAAGMDKNGSAFAAFEGIFGFQEPGTVIVPSRDGNPRIRMAAIESQMNLANAQGFPSLGVTPFVAALNNYRKSGGKAKIFVSICGLPISEYDAVDEARKQMMTLIGLLKKDVNGFVWNPFSPNTGALKLLRTPEVFQDTSKLMSEMAPNHLRLVKIGPYEPEEKGTAIGLVGSFLKGGGHGVVTTNTKMLPKEALPVSVRETWGYPSAGISGSFLRDYRIRSIRDIRSEFPDSIIVATGGIYNETDAYASFLAGANLLEGYTPYTYYGSGLLRAIMRELSAELSESYGSLSDLQRKIALDARESKNRD